MRQLAGARRQGERGGAVVADAIAVGQQRAQVRQLTCADALAHECAEAPISHARLREVELLELNHRADGSRERSRAVVAHSFAALDVQRQNGPQWAPLHERPYASRADVAVPGKVEIEGAVFAHDQCLGDGLNMCVVPTSLREA